MNRLVFYILLTAGCLLANNQMFAQSSTSDDKFLVVLDAGHGGEDSGNTGNGYYEKNIALNIMKKVGKLLEKDPDLRVMYTRKKDVFVTLMGRADVANKNNANLFVSIHCNAHSSQAYGTETFVLGLSRNKDNMDIAKKENSVIYLEEDYKVTYNGFDPKNPSSSISLGLMQEEYLDQSIMLADLVQKEFTNDLHRKDRGVKQNIFLVLRETYMPSVLVETGFLTNDAEGKFLNSKAGQNKMAEAIYEGIEAYKNNLNLKGLEVKGNKGGSKTDIFDNITFKVQIAAGSKPLETAAYNFNNLKGIERQKEGALYKYYFGSTSDYLRIQEKKREAESHGFSSCYIVAFKNGEKLAVNEALKTKAD
jgi:N-acetylmuramoyl-L-alanine amidase